MDKSKFSQYWPFLLSSGDVNVKLMDEGQTIKVMRARTRQWRAEISKEGCKGWHKDLELSSREDLELSRVDKAGRKGEEKEEGRKQK